MTQKVFGVIFVSLRSLLSSGRFSHRVPSVDMRMEDSGIIFVWLNFVRCSVILMMKKGKLYFLSTPHQNNTKTFREGTCLLIRSIMQIKGFFALHLHNLVLIFHVLIKNNQKSETKSNIEMRFLSLLVRFESEKWNQNKIIKTGCYVSSALLLLFMCSVFYRFVLSVM